MILAFTIWLNENVLLLFAEHCLEQKNRPEALCCASHRVKVAPQSAHLQTFLCPRRNKLVGEKSLLLPFAKHTASKRGTSST